ncbi:chorismate-binding protein [Streptomyces peucetius]|nr:hypothetical protein CGZ69_28900 [Streptomyces peucetius subsp. caesius ATCC 27952]
MVRLPATDSPSGIPSRKRFSATGEQDRAEHLTLVDVVRHDPGSLAPTTVSVDPFLDVETGATAHRMVSTVGAKLRADAGAAAALRSAFPDASDTGAPKPGTTRTTDGLESGPRGIHIGRGGYFSLTGAADSASATHRVAHRPRTLPGARLRARQGCACLPGAALLGFPRMSLPEYRRQPSHPLRQEAGVPDRPTHRRPVMSCPTPPPETRT